MFLLAELQDIVRIEPRCFSKDTGQEITDELNRKYANKVNGIKQTAFFSLGLLLFIMKFFVLYV